MSLNPRAPRLMSRKTYCPCCFAIMFPLPNPRICNTTYKVWSLALSLLHVQIRVLFFRVSFGLLVSNTLMIILLLPTFNKCPMKQAQELKDQVLWVMISLGLFLFKISVPFVTLWSGTRGLLLSLNEKIYQSTVEIYDLLHYGAKTSLRWNKGLKIIREKRTLGKSC